MHRSIVSRKDLVALSLAFALALILCHETMGQGQASQGQVEKEQAIKAHFVRTDDFGAKEIEALSVQDRSDRGMIDILLIQTPLGERFILYRIVDASKGEMRIRLEHDSSSWWVEHTTKLHGKFETISDFLDYSLEDLKRKKRVTYFIESDDLSCASTYDYHARRGQELVERFETYVLETEKCLTPFRALPREVVEGIFFLGLYEEDVLFRYDELVDFLGRILGHAGFKSDSGEERIDLERAGYEWGLGTMVTPEELEFTSRFKSIDNADPLAGFRPEELFPEE